MQCCKSLSQARTFTHRYLASLTDVFASINAKNVKIHNKITIPVGETLTKEISLAAIVIGTVRVSVGSANNMNKH